MIWLTWRLHRTESLIGLSLIGVLGVAIAITGLDIAETFRTMGLGACVAGAAGDEDATRSCFELSNAFFHEFDQLTNLVDWLNFLPVIFAMLLAAPFLNELEHGAFRLSWTQSIPRARWAAYRIGAILAAAGLLGGIWGIVMTWWMDPFTELRGRMESDSFNFQGIVPIAYFLFSASLLLAAGSISRRTVPTLLAALVVFLPVRLGIEMKLRPRFQEPLTAIQEVNGPVLSSTTGAGPRDWVVADGWVDSLGNRITGEEMMTLCPPVVRGLVQRGGFDECIRAQGLLRYEEYQPASRFWQFQLIETAIYVGLAAGLVALAFWWVTRRLA